MNNDSKAKSLRPTLVSLGAPVALFQALRRQVGARAVGTLKTSTTPSVPSAGSEEL